MTSQRKRQERDALHKASLAHHEAGEHLVMQDTVWRPGLRGRPLTLALEARMERQLQHVLSNRVLMRELQSSEEISRDRVEQVLAPYFDSSKTKKLGQLMNGTVGLVLKRLALYGQRISNGEER